MNRTVEYALLGLLREQSMHGYEMHQRLSESEGLGLVWHLKQSQLYALLNKLEQEEYVTNTMEIQEARPPRKVFHLTAAGREFFLQWVQSPVSRGRKLRLDFMAKLYFARREGATILQQLLHNQQQACHRWLTTEQSKAADLSTAQPFEQLVHQFRVGQIEATLAWLDQCKTLLLAETA